MNFYVQISAVTEIIGSVSIISSYRNYILLFLKMSFDSWVILDMNTSCFPLDTIMSVYQLKASPVITVTLNIAAS